MVVIDMSVLDEIDEMDPEGLRPLMRVKQIQSFDEEGAGVDAPEVFNRADPP